MQREIKFRVFNTKGNWGGKIVPWDRLQGFHDTLWDLLNSGLPFGEEAGSFVVMQYTGLKDKFGKEIYESDYVKDQSGLIWEVYFDMGQFLLKNKVIAYTPVSLYSEPVIEIIGNIYSTPELLDK